VKRLGALALFTLSVTATVCAAAAEVDEWLPVRRFVGEWIGTSSGAPGEGAVTRKYSFVMNGRYVQETNISRYPPQEKNKSGEVHEHWGMISYDKQRKLLVLRQFHVEGFVNTYRQVVSSPDATKLVFESEAFENLSNAWKARETYEFISDDEFVETFELAPPGKPFETYTRARFRRDRR
jgi:hypothetical protein